MILLPTILLSLSSLAFAVTVKLRNTTVVGTELSALGQEFFGGIPFAEPPIGSLRFKPPILKLSPENETFDATHFGAGCLQAGQSAFLPPLGPESEDCLTLNILRPSHSKKLPVMVWIYGGGFTNGAGSQYNGTHLVSQSISRGTPVIYVNFNYRLGPLGFPQGTEAARKGAHNLGLKDQLAALQWIQKNIAAFGGDPSKVTLFGESAGAISISIHFFNPQLPKLARAAIFQSGTASTTFSFNASRRQNVWDAFVSSVPECASLAGHANTFDCLRTVPTDTIQAAFEESLGKVDEELPYPPTLDGPNGVYPDLPSKMYQQGRFARLPFIAGTNLDEGTAPALVSALSNSSEIIREWIISNYTATPADIPRLHDIASKILKLYPDDPAQGSPYNTGNQTFGLGSQFKRLAAITGDLLFQAGRRLWIQSASAHGVKTFGYHFTDPAPPILAAAAPQLGVTHGLDVLYIYPGISPTFELTPAATNLSTQMIDYWISFATSLDPNDGRGSERPEWPHYTRNAKVLLELNHQNLRVVKDEYRKQQISFIHEHATLLRQ